MLVPIRVTCSCGHTLSAPDKYRGKQVKCPKCHEALAIPAAKAQTVGGKGKPPQADSALADLLTEVGFDKSHGDRSCPNCKSPFEPEAVLCIGCGYNLESGKLLRTKRVETRDPFGLSKGKEPSQPAGMRQFIGPGIVLGTSVLVAAILTLIPTPNYESMGLDRGHAELVASYAKFVVLGIGLCVAIALVMNSRPKKVAKGPGVRHS